MMKRLALFVSGHGTNMENLIRRIQKKEIGCEAALVVSDNPKAAAIEKAKRLGVEVFLIERERFPSKEAFEAVILHELDKRKIDLIALAGFMKILSPAFVRRWRWRMINIHPALLPAFPGAHAIRDAFDAKAKETGVTVHFVDEGIDTGPVILQCRFQVNPEDTLESLEDKIHKVEYELYPEALRKVLAGEIKFPGHHRDEEFWTND